MKESLFWVMVTHLVAVAAMVILVRAGLAPRLFIIAAALLFGRALMGLAKARELTAKQLGFTEVVCGALFVFAVVLGNTFGF